MKSDDLQRIIQAAVSVGGQPFENRENYFNKEGGTEKNDNKQCQQQGEAGNTVADKGKREKKSRCFFNRGL